MMLPNTFIIGAAKSGTTAVAAALSAHPEVFVPDGMGKEPFYFACLGKKPDWRGPGDRTDFVVHDIDAYRRLYSGATKESVVVDASTIYLYSPVAAENVRAFDERAKIVAVLRQPAERAYSAFLHVQRRTSAETSDFRMALRMEEQRIADGYDHLWHYKKMGLYAEQLQRWLANFPRSQVKVLFYDDLIHQPKMFYYELFKFLDVDPNASVDVFKRLNEGLVPLSKRLQSILLSGNSIKTLIAHALPPAFRALVWRKSLHKPRLDPDVRNELTQYFADDICQLEQLVGRDLSHWLTPVPVPSTQHARKLGKHDILSPYLRQKSGSITTPAQPADAQPEGSSYEQILKSSSILGGTQAAVYLISLLKTKVAAVLLGPQGIGLVGLYQSATAMVAILASLGLNSSGVREVAQAERTGDAEVLARTVKVLRRLCWITGAVGWFLTVLLAWPLSLWTFGTGEQAHAIIILGSTVFFGCMAGGQVALLQGMRRIADLALVNVLCVIGGSAASIALYAWLGAEGIVPALVASALISLGFNWWFSRRISVADIPLGWAETFRHSRQLLHLGVALMWNGLLVTAVALVTRSLIVRDLGLEANGLFQAAWAISGMFSGFILSAMGADFYPRLSAVAGDDVSLNRLVNEQTEIGVLLSLPGLVGTVVFAPALIELLYSSKFSGSTPLLPWFIVGVFIQVISWPIGFILLAKSHSKTFALLETAIKGVQILATFLFMAFFGLKGAAIAFAVTQGLNIVVYFSVVSARTKFVWSSAVRKLVLYGVTFLAAGIVVHSQCHGVWLFLLGGTVVAACGLISLRGVGKRLDPASRLGRQIMALPFARVFIAARPGN